MAQPTAPDEDLETKVAVESQQLQRLKEQLAALQSIDRPKQEPKAATVDDAAPKDTSDPVAKPKEIPSAPLPGAEEAFADTLFALGKYERARTVYQQVIDTAPPPKTASWINVQLGNCARKEGDFAAALIAYNRVMTDTPDSFWAEEAAWWTDQIKWRLLWKQVLNPEPLASAPITG